MAFRWLRCPSCRHEVPYEARTSLCDYCRQGNWRIISDADGELPKTQALIEARLEHSRKKMGI